MAERIVSPGVYTKEIDQSYLPRAIAQIGAAVVGPTVKGPALVPTKVSSYSEFANIFGSYSDDTYVPYVVNEYFRNGGTAMTVTRTLYEDGSNYQNGVIAVVARSGSTQLVTHVLHPTIRVANDTTLNLLSESTLANFQSGSFSIKLNGAYTGSGTYNLYPTANVAISASINLNANNYVTKIFGTNPKSTDFPVYVQYDNPRAITSFANLAHVTTSLAIFPTYQYDAAFKAAETPWITSQKLGTLTKNLFKFATLSHGTSVNHEVKIAIRDIKTSTEVSDPDKYAQFTIDVRRVNTSYIPNSPYFSADTDRYPDLLESFTVSLNPDSTRYIERVIGNQYMSINSQGDMLVNGDYPNQSQFVRVIVEDSVVKKNNDKSLLPFGFKALYQPIPVITGSVLNGVSYIASQTIEGAFNIANYHGFNYNASIYLPNNLNFLAPLQSAGLTTSGSTDFYLGDCTQEKGVNFPITAAYSGSLENALVSGSFNTNIANTTRKFIVPFQGGYDGDRPNLPKNSGLDISSTNTFGFNCSDTDTSGTRTYRKAFSLLSNTDYYDINMLLTPGILLSQHGIVAGEAQQLAENRQDTFYVMDSDVINATISTVKTTVADVDSNYTATYYPWVRITNPSKNVPVWVPPSVVIPGVLAFTDANAAPWYAPAGLNRGGLTSVSDTYLNLSQASRDKLYDECRVNPIANFPSSGIVVWGQKTLQARASALDRVNVRRMLIEVKKYIASATRFLVFEQNTEATRRRFLSIVNPYLTDVQTKQGLYLFKVVMDGTNNTADMIDRNIMYGQLFLQPTRTAEFILLDFNIQPTGASFPE
jgi:phage tail sheath protein FI